MSDINVDKDELFSKINAINELTVQENCTYQTKDSVSFFKIKHTNGTETIMCLESTICAANNPRIGIDLILKDISEKFRINTPIHPFDPVHKTFDEVRPFVHVRMVNRLNNVIDSNLATNFGNMVLVPTIEMNDFVVDINQYHLDAWNVTLKDILREAKLNADIDMSIGEVVPGIYMFNGLNYEDRCDIIFALGTIEALCSQANANVMILPIKSNIWILMPYNENSTDSEIDYYRTSAETFLDATRNDNLDNIVYDYTNKNQTLDFGTVTYTLKDIENIFS